MLELTEAILDGFGIIGDTFEAAFVQNLLAAVREIDVFAGLCKTSDAASARVYDFAAHRWVGAFEAGVLDSTPAVLEAVRNSLSIASILGTLGGVVVFPRDHAFERRQAEGQADYIAATSNPADERP